ncbi:hypothetical protein [Wenyingzhuangia aestuarii]|uniref:hypothetical protein n=1 Tax=Wenyingzhuangia aestuarii TaxID=1647582 RepID=UPI00143CAA17|nr:hypothetical protein [Wenyingzhuangia aestuarii]NJB83636.1 SOS-response transcriptional repressor LexA [Wenyingzhuangia aestuarii]
MKTKNLLKHLLSVLTVCFFIFIAFGSDDDGSKINEDGTPKTEQQIKVESQFSSWDGSHRGLTALIKKSMNDPDSYEHIETRFRDDGDDIYVITKFRGSNAFGGKVINTVSARVDFSGNVTEIISQE